jgi:hypothetical protein
MRAGVDRAKGLRNVAAGKQLPSHMLPPVLQLSFHTECNMHYRPASDKPEALLKVQKGRLA